MITEAPSAGVDAGKMGVRSQGDDATARRATVTLKIRTSKCQTSVIKAVLCNQGIKQIDAKSL
jgi:hypothetical protein